jgi:redox-sensitive bicupin YhaK (pirin superfamily)
VRRAGERGHADHGWLDTWHTFSFASYQDPRHMGFRSLRVINDDRVAAGKGFAMHPHQDMEIVTYVLEGALQHKDTLGNGGVIVPGEVQRMSAGTGIRHSEYNPSGKDPVHFLQIWLLPSRTGVRPSYGQKTFPEKERQKGLRLVASPDGRDGSISIHQDANLYASILAPGRPVTWTNRPGRHTWLQVARGSLTVNGVALHAGDGVSTSDPGDLVLATAKDAEVLLFDLN